MINRSLLICLLIVLTSLPITKCKRYPIILLFGYMGNQLTVKLQNADLPFGCFRNSFIRIPLWLDAIGATLFPECWQNKMMLNYDPKTHKSYSNRGVDIQTYPFGSVNGIDYLSPPPQQNRISEYFALLIKTLEVQAGYERNRNIFGALYDWRKSPHEQPGFFESLKKLCERAYYSNNKTPVILLGHSMGGNYFVRTSFFMAVPWAGNVKYLYSYLYNDDFAGNILPMFREIEPTFPALSFLLPNRRVFGKDDVLLETPNLKYTSYNLDDLFTRLGKSTVISMWKDTRDLMDPFVHPGTDVICVLGIGFNTMRKIVLTKSALVNGKYPFRLQRKRSIRSRRSRFAKRKLASKSRFTEPKVDPKMKELYQIMFNSTAFHEELTKSNRKDDVSTLEGKPRSKQSTNRIIDLVRGKFNTMFKSVNQLFRTIPNDRKDGAHKARFGIFSPKNFQYYWHMIGNILNPQLPKNAYDPVQGRYVFFSEGDSFVNIESGMKCLDWYSSEGKHDFFFDLINDNHLGMLRNQKSCEYFSKLIMSIK